MTTQDIIDTGLVLQLRAALGIIRRVAALAKGDGFFALANLQSVEVFRGANAIVSGAASSGGVGGAFNLVPKRPGEAPVTDLTLGWQAEGPLLQLDLSRRFGGADQFGARLNLSRFEARGPARQFERVTGVSAPSAPST